MVVAATDDKELNRRLVKKGRSMGAFVYAVTIRNGVQRFDYKYRRRHANSSVNIRSKSIMARRIRIRAERYCGYNKENRYRDGKITRIYKWRDRRSIP
jgi:siroheme synthase (precorrin-2 oxidase/ferrochelatase)